MDHPDIELVLLERRALLILLELLDAGMLAELALDLVPFPLEDPDFD